MQGDSDDPNAVFVALADGEVLGFAKLAFSTGSDRSRLPRPDRCQARVHAAAGSRPRSSARRSRGRRAHGYTSLQTSNEVRNEPIRRLNERHGYVLEPGVVIVRRTLR